MQTIQRIIGLFSRKPKMLCKPEKVSSGKSILFALQAKTHLFLLFRQHQPGADNVIKNMGSKLD